MIYYPAIQPASATNYQLYPDDAKYNSIRAMLDYAHLPIHDEEIYRLLQNPFYSSIPKLATCGMILKKYQDICSKAHQLNYISSNMLMETTKSIDMFPNSLGFLGKNVLKQECEFLIPDKLFSKSTLSQMISPMHRWRENAHHLQFHILGTALLLLLMAVFVSNDRRLSGADWSLLIKIFQEAPQANLVFLVNEAINEILLNNGN